MGDLYTYAVSRIRAKEVSLLSSHDMEAIIGAKSYSDAVSYLSEKGYGDSKEFSTYDELLNYEKRKTDAFLNEILPDSKELDIFRIKYDYHNLKAAVKSSQTDGHIPKVYMEGGTIEVENIIKAAKERDFSALPGFLRDVGEEALDTLIRTGDGQMSDIIIDCAYIQELLKMSCSSCEMIKKYAEIISDITNIKIAYRVIKMNKSKDFMDIALCDGAFVKKAELITGIESGESALMEYIRTTPYYQGAEELSKSLWEFEKYADNLVVKLIRKEKYSSFTIAPVAAYMIARENEINQLKLILMAKRNNLDMGPIKERMREVYA